MGNIGTSIIYDENGNLAECEDWAACLIIKLREERTAMQELHTMQLAAVSTATVQNTETTIKDRIGPDNPYYTTAYGDTCRAVDREMRLIADNAALRADKERLDFLDSQVWPDGKRSDPQPPILQLVVKLHHNPNGEWVNCAQNARKTIDAARTALAQKGTQ